MHQSAQDSGAGVRQRSVSVVGNAAISGVDIAAAIHDGTAIVETAIQKNRVLQVYDCPVCFKVVSHLCSGVA